MANPAGPDPLEGVLADLVMLEERDLTEQVESYERMHAALASALATTVDQQPGPRPGDR